MRERDIERYLVERVEELGGEVRKVQFIGHRGAPDRVVWLPVKHVKPYIGMRQIWIELKAPGKKPEAHQLREHARLRKLGQQVEVIDSFERVDEVLG